MYFDYNPKYIAISVTYTPIAQIRAWIKRVGVPPLYKVERGKQAFYCYDESELKSLQSTFPSNASCNIQRFKGLGEMMPLQLWETTMNPKARLLKKMVVEDVAEANVTFSRLMGARVDVRKEMIQNTAKNIDLKNLDI